MVCFERAAEAPCLACLKSQDMFNRERLSSSVRALAMFQPSLGRAGRLGRYHLVRRMAAGGMSDIYLGQVHGPMGYERTVVIKTLRRDRSEDEDLVAQVTEEARIAACLSHENIVRTLEVGRDGETTFLAMEFVFGRTLQQIVDRCDELGVRFPPRHIITVLGDGLEALRYAHEEVRANGRPLHLIHRDVSPANLMVGFDGVTRLLDFGLAKAKSQLSRTRAGMVKGRFGYMSPEQVHRDDLDGRSDVFGMGVVLWELLASRRLFGRPNELETIEAVIKSRIPWAKLVDHRAPAYLSLVAHRALQRHRAFRYSSADRMRAALVRFEQRGIDEARDELQAWLRELFQAEFAARELALEKSRRDPTRFRMLRDSGFELLPEVTDPAMKAIGPSADSGTARNRETPLWRAVLQSKWLPLVALSFVFFAVGVGVFLSRSRSGADDLGFLYVIASDVARVRVGGQAVGDTPLQRLPVAAGRHQVEVIRGEERVVEVVHVRAGQNRLIRVRFEQDVGRKPSRSLDESVPMAPESLIE